ncbi:MAG: helix-turn-helix transcriptional regulator [Acidaminococcaceae bacterium]|nr:helix-turn-helix transcriptional regulator [Acidaminococcaceae bacterium]
MTIAENIKNLRLKHNLSQEELAKIAGVSNKAVSTWETGTNEPRMGAIQRMADYFGILKSDIIEEPNAAPYYINPETAKLAQELHDNPDLHTLMNSTRKLSPAAVKEVQEFIKYQLAKERHEDD